MPDSFAAPPRPRYRQILDTLRDDIARGGFAVGDSLPTESELCETYAASRHTIREALRGLVELGIIARRQGSGSTVISATPNAAYIQTIRSLDDLFQLALDTHFTKLSGRMTIPGPAIQSAIGGAPGQSWHLMRGLRRDRPGGKPLCYIHSYIPERLAAFAPELPHCVGPFYGHLAKRADEQIIDAVQEITAAAMTAKVADHLGRPAGGVAMRVLRRYRSEKGIVITSMNWHAADDFVFRMQIQRA